MTVTVNLTSIPTRFDKLQKIIENLEADEIYIHIPREYNRKFDKTYKDLNVTGVTIQIVDYDYGPCTRYVYAKGDDVIIFIDDDTLYDKNLTKELVKKHRETGHVWGGSGFNFRKYFLGDFSKVQNEQVQVIEGYGMIVMNRKILDMIKDDVKRFSYYFPTSDDLLISNLLEKNGIKKFFYAENNSIKQLEYGFLDDSLHKLNNGSHMDTYKEGLKKLRELGEMHFQPLVTYGVTVCNEAVELRILLEVLVDTIVHSDEILVLADFTKMTKDVFDVISKFSSYVRFIKYPFEGSFADFKNRLSDSAKGEFIFQIDADEVPTGTLIEKLYILTHADLVYIPRVNIMLGMSESAMKLHGFNLNEAGFINFPDMQGRFYKKTLKWSGKLHEKIDGAQRVSQLPPDPKLCLWHVKTARKSKAQKEFYEQMS